MAGGPALHGLSLPRAISAGFGSWSSVLHLSKGEQVQQHGGQGCPPLSLHGIPPPSHFFFLVRVEFEVPAEYLVVSCRLCYARKT
jgi:hypothetical protein